MNQKQATQKKLWLVARIQQIVAICLMGAGMLLLVDAQSAFAQTGSITVVKNLIDNGNGDAENIPFNFKVSGGTSTTFTLDDNGNGTYSNTQTLSNLSAGTYTIVEDGSGYSGNKIVDANGLPIVLTSVDCGSANVTFAPGGESVFAPSATHPANVVHYGHSGAIINLQAGQNVTCTFTNTHHDELPHGGVLAKSVCNGGTTTDPVSFSTATAAGTTNSFTTSCGGARGLDFLAPGVHTITETPPAGWELVSISCSGGLTTPSDFVYDLANNRVQVAIADGKDPECTFTNQPSNNTQVGSITIVKQLVDNANQDAKDIDFKFNVSGGTSTTFELDDDSNGALSNTQVLSNLAAGTYTIVEDGNGYPNNKIVDANGLPIVLTNVDCGSANVTFAPGGESAFAPSATHPANVVHYGHSGAIINLQAGQNVTCTFTNTHHDELPHGGVTVEKVCNGGTTANPFSFSTAISAGTTNSFTTSCGGARGLDFLAPGVHTITETPPAGWELVSISCAGGLTAPSDFNYDVANNRVHITLNDGQDPECVFTNAQTSTPPPAGSPPGQPSLVSPSGDIQDTTPAFIWQDLGNATDYTLLVYDRDTTTLVHYVTHTAASACSGGTCSVTPAGLTLNLNRHLWRVRASNSAGVGPWSTNLYFTVTSGNTPPPPPPTGSAPGQVSLVSPSGNIQDTTPAFVWQDVGNATDYSVLVYDRDTTTIVHYVTHTAASACSGGTCSVTPAGLTLNLNRHLWRVKALNSVGEGPWSTNLYFTVTSGNTSPPGTASLVAPSGNVQDTTPAFVWQDLGNATDYSLLVYDRDTTTLVHYASHAAASVCSGGTCSVTPAGLTLNLNRHLWRVKALNDGGEGPWSNNLYLSVTAGNTSPPSAASLVSPSGNIQDTTPAFIWQDLGNADEYVLLVYDRDATTLVHYATHTAASACSGGTCSVTPTGVTLSPNRHLWRVKALNDGGEGPWSNNLYLTVGSVANAAVSNTSEFSDEEQLIEFLIEQELETQLDQAIQLDSSAKVDSVIEETSDTGTVKMYLPYMNQ